MRGNWWYKLGRSWRLRAPSAWLFPWKGEVEFNDDWKGIIEEVAFEMQLPYKDVEGILVAYFAMLRNEVVRPTLPILNLPRIGRFYPHMGSLRIYLEGSERELRGSRYVIGQKEFNERSRRLRWYRKVYLLYSSRKRGDYTGEVDYKKHYIYFRKRRISEIVAEKK